ncbi:Hypp3395 [Branchiostoma lanceolatum]|nr:Hypp3395 [Branchiostoma lanceolatum]
MYWRILLLLFGAVSILGQPQFPSPSDDDYVPCWSGDQCDACPSGFVGSVNGESRCCPNCARQGLIMSPTVCRCRRTDATNPEDQQNTGTDPQQPNAVTTQALAATEVTVPTVERTRCFGTSCPGFLTTGARCVDGFCECSSENYQRYTCLPVVGSCAIRRSSPAAQAEAFLSSERRETFSCVADDNNQYEVHVLGVYEGVGPSRGFQQDPIEAAEIKVYITAGRVSKHVILVLSSYEAVHWVITLPKGMAVPSIILIAHYIDQSDVTVRISRGRAFGFGPVIYDTAYAIVTRWSDRLIQGIPACAYGNDDGGCDTVKMLTFIGGSFMGPVSSFTGTYRTERWNLRIGNMSTAIPDKTTAMVTRSAPVVTRMTSMVTSTTSIVKRMITMRHAQGTSLSGGAITGIVVCVFGSISLMATLIACVCKSRSSSSATNRNIPETHGHQNVSMTANTTVDHPAVVNPAYNPPYNPGYIFTVDQPYPQSPPYPPHVFNVDPPYQQPPQYPPHIFTVDQPYPQPPQYPSPPYPIPPAYTEALNMPTQPPVGKYPAV